MVNLFNFEVHSLRRLFYSGKVQAVTVSLEDGEIGILAHHSPFSAHTVTGSLRIKDENGSWRIAFVCSGILEVKDHKTVLMVETAEWPEEINLEQILENKKQTEEMLKDTRLRFETERAKKRLHHLECKLKVFETMKR